MSWTQIKRENDKIRQEPKYVLQAIITVTRTVVKRTMRSGVMIGAHDVGGRNTVVTGSSNVPIILPKCNSSKERTQVQVEIDATYSGDVYSVV